MNIIIRCFPVSVHTCSNYIQYNITHGELSELSGVYNGPDFRCIYIYQAARRAVNVLNVLCVSKYLPNVIFR